MSLLELLLFGSKLKLKNEKAKAIYYSEAEGEGEESTSDAYDISDYVYGDAPNHVLYYNFADDSTCSHEKYSLRTYHKESCNSKTEYYEEDDHLWKQSYKDDKCEEKSGSAKDLGEYDSCLSAFGVGTKVQSQQ